MGAASGKARGDAQAGLRAWTRRELAFALGAVCLVWGVALAQWIGRDLVVPWDSKNQFYAFYRFMASAIEQGSTPFWNPFHYAGHPSVADPQSLIFAAPFIAWAFIAPAPSLFAFDAFVFAHLLVGGLALVLHGRAERWSVAASVLAASVFMLGGAASGRMNHAGIICAYGLFPLAWLLLRMTLARGSYAAAAGFAFVAAQIALGRSQTALLLCFALLALCVGHFCAQPQPLRAVRARLGHALVMGGLGAAFLAVPLLLSLQFMALSNRPSTPLDVALASSLHPLNLVTLFAPNAFGSLLAGTMGWGPSADTLPGVDATDRAFNYLFAGSLPALLLVWHGLAGARLFAPGRRVMAGLFVFGLVYALGRFTPVYPWLFEHAPGVSLFRRPNDGAFLMSLAFAYIVGALATDYAREGAPRLRLAFVAPLAAALAALGALALVFSAGFGKVWPAAGALAGALGVFAAFAFAMARVRTARTRGLALAVLVALACAELVWRNAASPLNAEPAAAYALLEAPRGEDARIVAALKADMAQNGAGGHRPRIEVLGLDGPWQNASMILGLEAINGYNPLRIGDYDRLVAPGESPHDVARRAFTKSFPNYVCPLSRRLGLRYLVLDQPIEHLPRRHDARQFTALIEGPRAWVYRFDDLAPSVRIVSQVKLAALDPQDEGAGALLETGVVVVDAQEELSQTYGARPAPVAMATIASWRPDRIEIDVHTSEAAIVTLNAPYYPGWEVEVDGKPRPIIKADLLFRGVEAPAGARRIVFAFRPLSWENLTSAFRDAFMD
jgi:hypothetical protein